MRCWMGSRSRLHCLFNACLTIGWSALACRKGFCLRVCELVARPNLIFLPHIRQDGLMRALADQLRPRHAGADCSENNRQ